MTVGQAIRKARKSKGYTQKQIAEKIGVGQTTVSFWETGKFSPTLIFAICLADEFGVSLDELVGRNVQEK